MNGVLPIGLERRFAGRRLHFDGQEWTVLYTDAAERMTLPAAGFDLVLQALRAGTIVLQTDAETIAAQPQPADRDNAVREWLLLDATIAGAQAQDSLPGDALDLLERRLAILTQYLSRDGLDPEWSRGGQSGEQGPDM
jgi:hypothetical protein